MCVKEVHFIKQAAIGYGVLGEDVEEKLAGAIAYLIQDYAKSGDRQSLAAARMTLEAYMQLGLPYVRHQLTFEQLLRETGEERSLAFAGQRYKQREIKATKTAIREVLGYWPKAAVKEQTVEFVVADILKRIMGKENGIWFYECERSGALFSLIMINDNIFLMDARNCTITCVYTVKKQQDQGEKQENDSTGDV